MKIIQYSQGITEREAARGVLVSGVPNEIYHSMRGISKSGLDLIAKSPAHYNKRTESIPSRALVIGTAIHSAILETELFELNYTIIPNAENRTCKAYKGQITATHENLTLTAPEGDAIKKMIDAAYCNPDVAGELSFDRETELSAIVYDREFGVFLRARFDSITSDGRALDLKKTRDARESGFSKSIYEYRYHVQAAFYNRVYKLITGCDLQYFKFLAIEDQAPNSAALYELDYESLEIGEFYMLRDLKKYSECVKSDVWPSNAKGGVIGLPYYAINRYEDDLDSELLCG